MTAKAFKAFASLEAKSISQLSPSAIFQLVPTFFATTAEGLNPMASSPGYAPVGDFPLHRKYCIGALGLPTKH